MEKISAPLGWRLSSLLHHGPCTPLPNAIQQQVHSMENTQKFRLFLVNLFKDKDKKRIIFLLLSLNGGY